MRVLLDTHRLIWWANDHPGLSRNAREEPECLDSEVFSGNFGAPVERLGFRQLPITLDQGQRAGLLPGPHQDPFDRLLIAQSIAENMPIVSNEDIFDSYTVRRIR